MVTDNDTHITKYECMIYKTAHTSIAHDYKYQEVCFEFPILKQYLN